MITRLVYAEERQAEAMERTADYLSTIIVSVKDIKVIHLYMDKILRPMAKKRKPKRMSIEDISLEFLNAEREPMDFDALIDEAIRVGMKEGTCENCVIYSMCHYPDGR